MLMSLTWPNLSWIHNLIQMKCFIFLRGVARSWGNLKHRCAVVSPAIPMVLKWSRLPNQTQRIGATVQPNRANPKGFQWVASCFICFMPHLKHTMSQIHAFGSPINTFCETAWHPFFYHVKKNIYFSDLNIWLHHMFYYRWSDWDDCHCYLTKPYFNKEGKPTQWSQSWLKVTSSMLYTQPTFLHTIQGRNTKKSNKGISSQHE